MERKSVLKPEMETRLILASKSPRRLELLRNTLQLAVDVIPSNADETWESGDSVEQIVQHLAMTKAAAVAAKVDRGVVIGADTLVVQAHRIYGKPTNEADAATMLRRLSGCRHEVYTGLAVYDALRGTKRVGHVRSVIKMRTIEEDELRAYIASGEPFDKAGAYGIQGFGSMFVERIEGDYFAVVGLPLHLLTVFLRDLHVDIWRNQQRA